MNRLDKDNQHYITNDGRFARLSLVMGDDNPGLRAWRNRVGIEEADRIAGEAADWGTRVHDITMYSDKKKFKEVEKMLAEDEGLLVPLLAWQDFVKTCIAKWLAIEKIVWSVKYKIAGKIDRVGLYRGDKTPAILDLKTGSLVEDIGCRLYGYKIMWNERNPKKKVGRTLAIQLPRRDPGSVKAKEYDNPFYEEKFIEKVNAFHEIYG